MRLTVQYGIWVFMGVFCMLSWMFQHDYLDTYCFDLYACVLHFCICICSAQLSMFHMERHSRNTLIIIIIIMISADVKRANQPTILPANQPASGPLYSLVFVVPRTDSTC